MNPLNSVGYFMNRQFSRLNTTRLAHGACVCVCVRVRNLYGRRNRGYFPKQH